MKGPGMYEKILVATDGSSYSEDAVDYAISLTKSSGAELIALHVATIDPSIGMIWENVKDIVLGRQKEMLEGIKEKAEEKGVKVRVVLETGIPSEKIVEVAEREGVDIIIMGSHGHTKIGKVIIGSVTERVAGSANCPVTVIGTKK